MTRGRRPLPSAVHKLNGNPGKRKAPAREPRPKAGLPSAPAELGKEGRLEWERVGAELLTLGLVSAVDRAALAGYCFAWERALKAQRKLKREGETITTTRGNVIQHPSLGIYNRAMKQLREFAIEFGMTPAARRRVESTPPNGGERTGEGDAERFLFDAPPLRLVKRA